METPLELLPRGLRALARVVFVVHRYRCAAFSWHSATDSASSVASSIFRPSMARRGRRIVPAAKARRVRGSAGAVVLLELICATF
jgi:hypothetical protein